MFAGFPAAWGDALERADLDAVQDLIPEYARSQNLHGETALMCAVRLGKRELCEILSPLEAGLVTSTGETALTLAIEADNLDICHLLAPQELMLSLPFERTALHVAAAKNSPEVLDALMKMTWQCRDSTGMTPVESAIATNAPDALSFLLNYRLLPPEAIEAAKILALESKSQGMVKTLQQYEQELLASPACADEELIRKAIDTGSSEAEELVQRLILAGIKKAAPVKLVLRLQGHYIHTFKRKVRKQAEEIANLRDSLEASETFIQTLSEQVDDLTSQLQALSARPPAISTSVDTTDLVPSLMDRSLQLSSRHGPELIDASLMTVLTQATLQEEHRREVNEVLAAKDSLTKQLEELQKDYALLTDDFQARRQEEDKANMIINDLKQLLSEQRARNEELCGKAQDYEKELSASKNEVMQTADHLQTVQNALAAKATELNKLKEQLAALQKERSLTHQGIQTATDIMRSEGVQTSDEGVQPEEEPGPQEKRVSEVAAQRICRLYFERRAALIRESTDLQAANTTMKEILEESQHDPSALTARASTFHTAALQAFSNASLGNDTLMTLITDVEKTIADNPQLIADFAEGTRLLSLVDTMTKELALEREKVAASEARVKELTEELLHRHSRAESASSVLSIDSQSDTDDKRDLRALRDLVRSRTGRTGIKPSDCPRPPTDLPMDKLFQSRHRNLDQSIVSTPQQLTETSAACNEVNISLSMGTPAGESTPDHVRQALGAGSFRLDTSQAFDAMRSQASALNKTMLPRAASEGTLVRGDSLDDETLFGKRTSDLMRESSLPLRPDAPLNIAPGHSSIKHIVANISNAWIRSSTPLNYFNPDLLKGKLAPQYYDQIYSTTRSASSPSMARGGLDSLE
ncbi:Ankyrin repeat protein 1 [Giardia muris]|uniref:Ankyrin repeat protein 1 n=1 Tax=Giardia muris TaxID=5742 RepID=A0A4Z1T3L2_GIAMU|nr:Ankyrin repeat protein 1 [Giardia muris]|eukprot:TNJ27647.1 Ankyrin repeat protein 1 [Giardia muris]